MKHITGHTTGKRILRAMIEDDPNVRELLALYLSQRAIEDDRRRLVKSGGKINNLVQLKGRLVPQ